MNNLNELSKEVHSNAVAKGFYDMPKTILEKMSNKFEEALFSEDEIKTVKDAFITQRLMLIVSELGEAMEANRKNRKASLEDFNKQFDFEKTIKDTFEDELADTVIRIGDLAGWLDIDLQTHVKLKHLYNTSREKMHGGKLY